MTLRLAQKRKTFNRYPAHDRRGAEQDQDSGEKGSDREFEGAPRRKARQDRIAGRDP